MTPAERIALIQAALEAEAIRQAKDCVSMPYVGGIYAGETLTLDGDFDMDGFAKAAIFATLQSLLKPTRAEFNRAARLECCPNGCEVDADKSDPAGCGARKFDGDDILFFTAMINAAIKEHSE